MTWLCGMPTVIASGILLGIREVASGALVNFSCMEAVASRSAGCCADWLSRRLQEVLSWHLHGCRAGGVPHVVAVARQHLRPVHPRLVSCYFACLIRIVTWGRVANPPGPGIESARAGLPCAAPPSLRFGEQASAVGKTALEIYRCCPHGHL